MLVSHCDGDRLSINTPWLAFVKPNPQATLRMFCFPYSGGGATAFRTWSSGLPASVEICPVQLPGRETRLRERPFDRIAPLVQAAAPALLPYLDKPFVFFGHSVGALVAFELARHLRCCHGLQPVHLFASGRGAPHVPDPEPPIHALPEREFVEQIRRYNGTPQELLENDEIMELFSPILRADFAINETYVYTHKAPLDCSITALGGLQDDRFSLESLKAWREQTTMAFKLEMFPGGHFFLNSAQPLLLRTVHRELRELVPQARGGGR